MFLGFLIGIIGGIVAGMGMGGGTLLIPMLTLFLGFEQKAAQTVTLVAFVVLAIFVVIIHFKNGLIDWKSGTILAIFGVISAVITALLTRSLSNGTLKTLFGIFLIVLAVIEFISIFKKSKEKKGKNC